jgi:membrane-associated phospholipid phosphatase
LARHLTRRPDGPCFWPVDYLLLAYLSLICCLILGWFSQLPLAGALLALHLGGIAAIVYQVKRPNPTTWVFRNWYPSVFVASCYKVMATLIPVIRRSNADEWLAGLDYRLWGAHPTVWLERIYHPVLTEFLQIVYALFIPAVFVPLVLLWRRKEYGKFQYLGFLVAIGYLSSYIGYLFVPARGPRFLLSHLEHIPLEGKWLFATLQATLDRLESAHYDCFPSGHTELTIIAWWGSGLLSKKLFRVYFAYTLCIIFATVYLRYHYTVDLAAGAVLAMILILTTPLLYNRLAEGSSAFAQR